jgi:hypothetical protein
MGAGTETGDVRRKLPAERTVLRPCEELCDDDDEEWEDDVLGFCCILIGIWGFPNPGWGVIVDVAVFVIADGFRLDVLFFTNSALNSASIFHIPLTNASRSREPVWVGSDWSQIALNLSLLSLDFDHMTCTIAPGSLLFFAGSPPAFLSLSLSTPSPWEVDPERSNPSSPSCSEDVTKSIDKPLHPLRSRLEIAIAEVGERKDGFGELELEGGLFEVRRL